MPDSTVERIQEWLRQHEQEILETTQQMLRIASIEGDPAPNAPFGAENRQALDLALGLANSWGMKTKDLEGYIGYAEFGQGDRLIVSLGHLDVVPVGPGWKHEPFGAEIDGGYVYARGATDDKGPTMASFWAARAIMECVPDLPARIRQVFGCNEESGFKCVARYVQTEEAPTLGVAPDSGWPLYHAEKGIANLMVSVALNKGADFELLKLEGGQRPNIVIDSCTAEVKVSDAVRKEVVENLTSAWDRNVEVSWEGDRLVVKAIGKAAHGSTPFLGDSAATRVLRFLREVGPLSTESYFEHLLESTHVSGVGLGIHGNDDVAGDLTNNLGIVATDADRIRLTFNIRYPVKWKGEELRDRCLAKLGHLVGDWQLDSYSDSPALYFPLDHPLVKTICDVYQEETGDTTAPGTMGGGTYARAIPNTVSIGTGWEGDGKAHETDERLKVENLYKMARIYAHILYRLATQP